MLNKASSLLFRHAGVYQHPVKIIIHWILAATDFLSSRGISHILWVACASITVITLIIIFLNTVFAEAPQGPNLGQPASPEQIAHWDIGIMPDGEGLPAGKGSVKEGKIIYDKHCAACHGPEGVGGTADQLAGAKMPLTSEYPEQTIGSYWPYATTIFDMTRRSMPMSAPGTLANDEVYAITAYLLYLNNIIGENDEMNAKTLPKVQMPNRDGFINVYEQEKSK
jgi:cytochrome c